MGQKTQLKIPCFGVCFNVIGQKLLITAQSPDISTCKLTLSVAAATPALLDPAVGTGTLPGMG